MKRPAARLAIALTTFLFSLFVTAALTRVTPTPDAPAPDQRPTPEPPPCVTSKNTLSDDTNTAKKTPRISQQKIVSFPGIGRVSVTANEACELCPELEFRDAATNKFLTSTHFSGDDDTHVHFRVLHIRGLPDPLVVGVSVSPGGSDSGWRSDAVGAVDGELRKLTSESLGASNQGGFYYGDLGGGRGLGAIGCDFIWDDDEGHYTAHPYELKVYKWDKTTARFEWHQVLRTSGKFDDGEKAARSLRFRFADIRKTFTGFGDWLD